MANLARIASGQENLARLYRDMGEHKKAEQAYEKILTLRKSLPDKDEYLTSLREAAKFYADRGECCYDKAASYYEEAARIALEDKDDEFAQLFADIHSELALVYGAQGEQRKAADAFKLARAFQNATLLERQDAVTNLKAQAEVYEEMGDAFAGLGSYDLAREAYERATVAMFGLPPGGLGRISLKSAALFSEHPDEKQKEQDYAEAEKLYEFVASLNDPANPENPSKDPALLAAGLRGLGALYAGGLNRPQEAEPLLKRSLEVSQSLPQGSKLAEENKSLAELAKLYRRQGKSGELGSALTRRAENAAQLLGNVHGRLGKESESLSFLLGEGLGLYAEVSREYIEANRELAAFYAAQRREDDALALYKAMLGDTEKAEGTPDKCCIILDFVADTSVLKLYADSLGDYRRLLLARGLTQEAEKVAAYIKKVEAQAVEARKLGLTR